MNRAYYNEIDEFAAAWLRKLIDAGMIADGDVDTRSVVDVRPSDLLGYAQCHFFAGIGVWSYALRLAGWPDDRPVWTGSCPCQPFSAAGKGNGFDDERHLWPSLYHLIRECEPPVWFGEQVASKDGLAWLDLVQSDLEGAGYACGAVDLCVAGVGAPHIRQRLWPVAERMADAMRDRAWNRPGTGLGAEAEVDRKNGRLPGERLWSWVEGASGRLADARRASDERLRQSRGASGAPGSAEGEARQRQRGGASNWAGSSFGRVADVPSAGWRSERKDFNAADSLVPLCNGETQFGRRGTTGGMADHGGTGLEGRDARSLGRERPPIERDGRGEPAHQPPAGPTNGLWRDADWLFCRDGKWRPVEPGTFPLVDGAPARVGRLRGYGNAINAEAAAQVIGSYLDVEHERSVRVTELFA